MLKAQPKVAVVCARGLGDALISMVLANNLALSGHSVTIFSTILCELKEWFPAFHIIPYPTHETFQTVFASFDTLIAADHSLIQQHHHFGNQLIILKENTFDKSRTMVENLQLVCKDRLILPFSVPENGMTPLKHLSWRCHPKRVVVHPTSSDEKKNWSPEKFIKLVSCLEQDGFDPYFCTSPSEAPFWKQLVSSHKLPQFSTVGNLASFIYESGYMIGNDSGVGHLASALQIPTLSIFARKSYAYLWRPGWGPGHVISPPPLLLGARLKQKYWKKLLSVQKVLKAFQKLRERS